MTDTGTPVISGVTIDPSSVTPLPSTTPTQTQAAGSVPPISGVTIDPSSVTPLPTAPTQPKQGAFGKLFLGPGTAAGAPISDTQSSEVFGVSDVLHGNLSQGFGKIVDAETPHIIAGSPIEKLIQTFKPDFKGSMTPEQAEIQNRQSTAGIQSPAVDAAQFIDKQKHPVLKALTESAQSMTSPSNVAIMISTGGMGLVESPKALAVANRLISAGFTANAVGQAYKNLKGFKEAYDKGDSVEALYQLTHAVTSGTMAYIAGTHAAGAPVTQAAPTTEVGQVIQDRLVEPIAQQVSQAAGAVQDAAGNIAKTAVTPFDRLANYVAKGNEEFGVPLSRGQAGGNISGAVESGLKKIPIINRPFAKLGTAQAEALNAAADKIISPTADVTKLSPAERGQHIQDQLDIAKSQASNGYETALNNLAKTGASAYELDTTNLRTTAQELIDNLAPAEGFEEGLGSTGRVRAIRMLQDFADNDQGITVGDAIKLRSQLGQEIYNGEMKPYKAVLSKMRNALNDELTATMTKGAVTEASTLKPGSTVSEAAENAPSFQFLDASERYAEVSEALRNKVIKSLRNADPQAVGSMLLNKISPDVTESLKTLSPGALVSVGDGLLQTMFDKVQGKNGGVLTGDGLGKLWDGIDPKVRSSVFGPELPKIQRFVDLVKKLDLQKAKTGWSGSKIATGAATGTAVGIETGMALAAHTIPPFSVLAAGTGFGGYELSKILTGRGGEAFLDTLKEAADDTKPDQQAAASDKLQKMAKPVNPYKTPFVKNKQAGVFKIGGPDNSSEGSLPKVQR
jgi:hypothetical protein